MAVLATLATPLAMRPDLGSNLVMQLRLVTAWQRRLRSVSVRPAQFRLGMGSPMRLGMGCYRRHRHRRHRHRRHRRRHLARRL